MQLAYHSVQKPKWTVIRNTPKQGSFNDNIQHKW